MDNTPASSPIVVGIDGSKYAIRAAIWAVDEAVRRDAALLLTCVIDSDAKDLDQSTLMRATCCMRHGAPPKRPENLSNSNQQCCRVIPWPS